MLSFGWRAENQSDEQLSPSRPQEKSLGALTTAGEGTWMLATERGEMLLAKWQRTTPSIRAAPTSSGSNTFSLDSMFCQQDNKGSR